MNNDNKDATPGLNRRSFLKTSTGLALAGAGTMMFPSVAAAKGDEQELTQFRGHNSDKRLWKKVRKEFVLNKRTTYMNVGTSGSMPKSILKSYARTNEMISANPWQSNVPTIELAKQVAPGFGAYDHELVLNRNTTDGMNSIINGLQFEEGDVILTTHHEHGAVKIPLKHVSDRYNVEVVEIEIPVYTGNNTVSEDDFVNVFADAVAEYLSLIHI